MQKEVRTYNINFRAAAGDERIITGTAAVFNSFSEPMGGFVEKIDRSAFQGRLKDDVRALFNHDPNLILARTKSGTLELWVDDDGLNYRFHVPETTFGNDFWMMVKRGDIDQSSFSFTIDEDEWEEQEVEGRKVDVRTIKKVKRLFDISPVTYPAYTATDVTARSYENFKKKVSDEQEEKNERKIEHENKIARLQAIGNELNKNK